MKIRMMAMVMGMAAVLGLLVGLTVPVQAATLYVVPLEEAALQAPGATHCSVVTYADTAYQTTAGAGAVVTNFTTGAGTTTVQVVAIKLDRPFRDASEKTTTNCFLSVGTASSATALHAQIEVNGLGDSAGLLRNNSHLYSTAVTYAGANVIRTWFTNTITTCKISSNDVGQARIYFRIAPFNE